MGIGKRTEHNTFEVQVRVVSPCTCRLRPPSAQIEVLNITKHQESNGYVARLDVSAFPWIAVVSDKEGAHSSVLRRAS